MVFFITGASSFIGVEICRYLSDCGHDVIAMSRRDNASLNQLAAGGRLQVLRADMHNLVERAANVKADVFMHFAWAGTSHDDRNDPAIQEVNLVKSLEYVRLAGHMGCRLYVDAGSQAEYGIVPGPVTEETACKPITAYGKCKLQMYRETAKMTEETGMKYIHLRIFSVYGENDHPDSLIMSSLRKMRAGELLEMHSGGQMWNYLYVKDAARQIVELSLSAVSNDSFDKEVYHIASGDTRVLKNFILAMKHVTGSSSELRFGGYEKEKDVNLEPSIEKTEGVVKPVTLWRFEDVIREMSS